MLNGSMAQRHNKQLGVAVQNYLEIALISVDTIEGNMEILILGPESSGKTLLLRRIKGEASSTIGVHF